MPKRVINLGLIDDSAESVRSPAFIELTDGGYGRYAALSYCWGPTSIENQPLLLTTQNKAQLQQVISECALPKTIQQAIEVTRHLRIPFLWVDRLCIIQDDPDDWREEASKMCAVYEAACLTITALGAEGGDDGLFLPRASTPAVRIPLSVGSIPIGHMSIAHLCDPLDPRLKGASAFTAEMQTNAWNPRGWTLQERFLSRRIVYFGRQQLYWECYEAAINEDGVDDGSGIINSNEYCSKLVTNANFASDGLLRFVPRFLPGQPNSMNIWESILRDYTSRNLSVLSDKLRAIDGVAAAIQKRLVYGEYSYRCGLTESTICSCGLPISPLFQSASIDWWRFPKSAFRRKRAEKLEVPASLGRTLC